MYNLQQSSTKLAGTMQMFSGNREFWKLWIIYDVYCDGYSDGI